MHFYVLMSWDQRIWVNLIIYTVVFFLRFNNRDVTLSFFKLLKLLYDMEIFHNIVLWQ